MLKDKSNFVFEFRDAMNFKNVPDKVKCYYLNENKLHKINPVVDESDQEVQYGFVYHSNTPPATPRPFSPSVAGAHPLSPAFPTRSTLSPKELPKCPFSQLTPGINITEATPTPSSSKRSSLVGSEISLSSHSRSSTPDEWLDDPGLQMKMDEHHSPFLDVMRRLSGLEPVTEADEETVMEGTIEQGKKEAIPTVRKISNGSNVSADSLGEGEGKTALRKVSDASSESGILSSGSKTSEGGGVEHKSSTSSYDDGMVYPDELHLIRRSGSVSDKIKKFDTLSRERQRKTGLHCVTQESEVQTETTLNTKNDKLRPERKSLESIGSASSNDCIEP